MLIAFTGTKCQESQLSESKGRQGTLSCGSPPKEGLEWIGCAVPHTDAALGCGSGLDQQKLEENPWGQEALSPSLWTGRISILLCIVPSPNS